ncbi:MAG: hypothetical protein J1F68_04570 [Clostridiales bacterium]|nr:hypothetical protein [Clostridiales bacterium]
MNSKSAIKYRAVFYIFMILTVASLVTGICLLGNYGDFVSYVLFGAAGAFVLVQLLVATIATTSKGNNHVNGFEQWLVSLEVLTVILLVVALSPILLILWLVDAIQQAHIARNSTKEI